MYFAFTQSRSIQTLFHLIVAFLCNIVREIGLNSDLLDVCGVALPACISLTLIFFFTLLLLLLFVYFAYVNWITEFWKSRVCLLFSISYEPRITHALGNLEWNDPILFVFLFGLWMSSIILNLSLVFLSKFKINLFVFFALLHLNR